MQFVPTGLLTLNQAIERLIEMQAPGLSQKVARESLEFQQLEKTYAPVSRAPPPIRPITDRRGPDKSSQHRESTTQPFLQLDEGRSQSRACLLELRKDQATLAERHAQVVVQLGQALCDAELPAWMLSESTGERIPIPAVRWSTKEGAAALRSGIYTLIKLLQVETSAARPAREMGRYQRAWLDAMERAGVPMLPHHAITSTNTGTVVIMAADLDRWIASKSAARAGRDALHIQDERQSKPKSRPSDAEVLISMIKIYQNARENGKPPPKYADGITRCMKEAGATSRQAKTAMRSVPEELRTKVGRPKAE
jgi:hypothetical protein